MQKSLLPSQRPPQNHSRRAHGQDALENRPSRRGLKKVIRSLRHIHSENERSLPPARLPRPAKQYLLHEDRGLRDGRQVQKPASPSPHLGASQHPLLQNHGQKQQAGQSHPDPQTNREDSPSNPFRLNSIHKIPPKSERLARARERSHEQYGVNQHLQLFII